MEVLTLCLRLRVVEVRVAKRKGSVLISSAGRRVSLVRHFQQALLSQRVSGAVIASDVAPAWSAACRVADVAVPMPRVDDAEFVPKLLDVIQAQDVRLLVPTIDTELLTLAHARQQLAEAGCVVAVSASELVRVCRDKRLSEPWLRGLGFEVPRRMESGRQEFPCFAKPYDGSLSRDAIVIHSVDMITPAMLTNDRLIFEEYCDPKEYDEYTIDAYFDRNGRLRCHVPRRRVEVRGGEISKGITQRGFCYDHVAPKLAKIVGARGCMTFQCFVAKNGGRCLAVEMNPRFGGGFPLSYAAGARYPDWLVAEYLLEDELADVGVWQNGMAMVRYDEAVYFQGDE